ncbi:MAG: hypothetical protein ACFFFH_20810 [Candidatus Thorarchaeota archaeon]
METNGGLKIKSPLTLLSDKRAQVFLMATLVIAFYMILMTSIIIETQSQLYQSSDADILDRFYRDIRRECQSQADIALKRLQNGEPESNVRNAYLTSFINDLVSYGTSLGISTQIDIDSAQCLFTASIVSIPDILVVLVKGDSFLGATFSIQAS